QNNIFNYQRANGATMGASLLAAIDTTENMVWVDIAMNQAKSNVVNENRATAASPPQQDKMNSISDFQTNANIIFEIEYFARNFAALGQYFAQTSGVFSATAARIQALLAEITPDSPPDPEESLPLLFDHWLENLIATYPSGCSSRASNVYNYYRAKMNTVSAKTRQGVPSCFALFTMRYSCYLFQFNPSAFNYLYQALLPPAPNPSRCNPPGTTGGFGFWDNGQANILPVFGTVRVMGSGSLDMFAIGGGNSISSFHWQAGVLPNAPPSCSSSFFVNDLAPDPTLATVYVAFDCSAPATSPRSSPMIFSLDPSGNTQSQCVLIATDSAGSLIAYNMICAPSTAAAAQCANDFFRIPNGAIPAQLNFFPN
ncbi:hypothetical protein C8J56DRAFT_768520, partial [Mycena floridula]